MCIRFHPGCIIIVKKITKDRQVIGMLHNCFHCGNYVILMINIMEAIESINFLTDISPTPNLYIGRYDF